MLRNKDLAKMLDSHEEIEKAEVSGDGYLYQLTVVSKVFEGQSKVARQQWVYAQLSKEITTGQLHAISMKTYTPEEWRSEHG